METKATYDQLEIQNLVVHLQRIKALIRKFEHWYELLDKKSRQRLRNLYESAINHLIDAKADISALTSEYLVCIAATLVEKEEEEKE